jgi:hypothetical protein
MGAKVEQRATQLAQKDGYLNHQGKVYQRMSEVGSRVSRHDDSNLKLRENL